MAQWESSGHVCLSIPEGSLWVFGSNDRHASDWTASRQAVINHQGPYITFDEKQIQGSYLSFLILISKALLVTCYLFSWGAVVNSLLILV